MPGGANSFDSLRIDSNPSAGIYRLLLTSHRRGLAMKRQAIYLYWKIALILLTLAAFLLAAGADMKWG